MGLEISVWSVAMDTAPLVPGLWCLTQPILQHQYVLPMGCLTGLFFCCMLGALFCGGVDVYLLCEVPGS